MRMTEEEMDRYGMPAEPGNKCYDHDRSDLAFYAVSEGKILLVGPNEALVRDGMPELFPGIDFDVRPGSAYVRRANLLGLLSNDGYLEREDGYLLAPEHLVKKFQLRDAIEAAELLIYDTGNLHG